MPLQLLLLLLLLPAAAKHFFFQKNIPSQYYSTITKTQNNLTFQNNIGEEEEEEFTNETNEKNKTANYFGAIFFILAGAVAGYYLSSFMVETVGYVPDDDDEEEGKEGEKSDGNTGSMNYKKQFLKFADIEVSGEKYLSAEAFVTSLISHKANVPSWVAFPRRDGKLLVDKRLSDESLKLMFSYADANSDGMISFDEYSLFLTLLSSTRRQLKLAFQMFDLDNSGEIDLAEFKNVIEANKKDPNVNFSIEDSALTKNLFGPDGKGRVTFKEFNNFIESFKDQLLMHEFLQHDVEGKNEISIESFNELITSSIHFNSINIPEFKKQLNLLKTRGFFKPTGRVDFETFKTFHLMSERIDDLKVAMQLYTASGKTLKKKDFTNILNRVANIEVAPKTVDLVFALFDKDGDGNLGFDEFVDVMEQRSANSSAVTKE